MTYFRTKNWLSLIHNIKNTTKQVYHIHAHLRIYRTQCVRASVETYVQEET